MEAKSRYRKYIVDIEDYKVIKNLQSGGFGSVFSVENINTKDTYAAKVLDTHKDDKSYNRMINREIGIMIRCQHPTIIKLEGYSLTDFDGKNNVTIFMELAKKGSLADYLQNVQNGLADGTYDNTNRQIILAGVARGMMHLHQHQIIHRDLKPGNILLDEHLHPHITDFGLSKVNKGGNSLISQSQTCGTSMYMAPECIDGSRINGKADVYSFGILMYEVVTDTSPYPLLEKGKLSAFRFNQKVINEDYRPEFKVSVKKSIKKLIERCWAREPQDRPTFEEIFKKLAYNIEDSVKDIYDFEETEADDEENTTEEDESYYLDDVDVDEVLAYADSIDDDKPLSPSTDDGLMAKVESMIKAIVDENTKMKQQLEEIRKENEQLKEQMEETDDKISSISSKSHKSRSSDSDDEEEDDPNSLKSQVQSIKEFVREMRNDMIEKDDLDDQLGEVKNNLNEKLEEIKDDFNEKLEKLEKNIEEKSEKSDDKSDDEKTDDIEKLKAENAELSKKIKAMMNDYADLKKDEDEIKKKISQIEKQINSISNNKDSNKAPKKEAKRDDIHQSSSNNNLHLSSNNNLHLSSNNNLHLSSNNNLHSSSKSVDTNHNIIETESENNNNTKNEDEASEVSQSSEVSKKTDTPSDFNKSMLSIFSRKKYNVVQYDAPTEPIDPNKITIGEFNQLPLLYQQQTMSDILNKTPGGKTNPFFKKTSDFLNYLVQINPDLNNCFEIYSGTPIKVLCKVKGEHQARLLFQGTEALFHVNSFDFPLFNKMISEFNNSSIEIRYPSKKFKAAYDIFTYLQKEQKGKVKLGIFVTKSDLKFKGNTNVNIVKLDPLVTVLEGGKSGGCFEDCKNLSEVILPETLTAIETSTFKNCQILSRIKLPLSLKRIGSYAFNSCSSITEIDIPNSITEIKPFTFDHCRSLKVIKLPESITIIGSNAFSSTPIDKLNIPNSVTEIGNGAFEECKKLKEINIPTNCATIGDCAFRKCTSLEQITFPNSLKKLGNESFIECKSLNQITFAEGSQISAIGDLAFMNCTSLTEITLPGSVTAIGNQTFRGCKKLEKAFPSKNLKSVGDFAFADCSALQFVYLPKSAKQIGSGAFPKETKVVINK